MQVEKARIAVTASEVGGVVPDKPSNFENPRPACFLGHTDQGYQCGKSDAG